ncbi:MAG: PKD domain-containing protein, partial [Pirellulales bacterium]|nr:PKD domain-containing protein [Pirellulales bacterium]
MKTIRRHTNRRGQNRSLFRKTPRVEQLEPRLLLAGDIFEPNDSFDQAFDLVAGPQGHSSLSIHEADNDDYYVWEATNTSWLSVAIQFSHRAGDLDLYVYNANRQLLDSSTTTTDDEGCGVQAYAGQTYYVRVHGYKGATSPDYLLQLHGDFPIPQDRFEPNDSLAQARYLGSSDRTEEDLTIHLAGELQSNDDYFRWTSPTDGTVAVDARFVHALGDLQLEIFDASGRLLDESTSHTDNERVTATAQPGQTFFIHVYGFAGWTSPDYDLVITGPQYDCGDAPDSYPTTGADAARHTLSTVVWLADAPDSEPTGQPDLLARGDDNDGTDDEDGAMFLTPLIPGQPATFWVYVEGVRGIPGITGGVVQGWVDFDRSGSWEADEQIFNGFLPFNAYALPFNVPNDAVSGTTFARFRVSLQGGLEPWGTTSGGEVEDHYVYIEAPQDFGDAPDPYPTTGEVAARHVIAGPRLGGPNDIPDAEPDGQPDPNAYGDDNDGNDDENGIGLSWLRPGIPDTFAVEVSGGGGYFTAWIDFDQNGSFDPYEQVHNEWLDDGDHTIHFPVPVDAVLGTTFARFRISTEDGLSPEGGAPDGEVEDYRVTVQGIDFGDAPEGPYPTTRDRNGAMHYIHPQEPLFLGEFVDAEPDGQPNADATGDDVLDGSPDEQDDVNFLTPLWAGGTAEIEVYASGDGYLQAWIDFNGNGDWGDPEDRVFLDKALVGGFNLLTFDVPNSAAAGSTFARFRFSTARGLDFVGLAHDGEVVDYQVQVQAWDFGDAPKPYPTQLPDGARHPIRPDGPWLGDRADFPDSESDGQPQSAALGDDNDGNDDEDGLKIPQLQVGRDAEIEVTVGTGSLNQAYVGIWIDLDQDGVWQNPGERVFGGYLPAGVHKIPVVVPREAVAGTTFLRARIANHSLTPQGIAEDGEVEDYRVEIVGNLPPVADPNGPYIVDEGTPVTLDGSGSYDPDPGDHIFSYEWDLDDDGVYDTYGPGPLFEHTWLDDTVTPVWLQVTDTSGESDAASTMVEILNARPEVSPASVPSVEMGQTFALDLATFTDAGVLDTHTARIDWGDETIEPGDVREEGGSGAVSGMHVYAAPGDYPVSVRVTDDDGGWGIADLTIRVLPVDFGDAPQPYPTTRNMNGARHRAMTDYFDHMIHFGNIVDEEGDGQPHFDAQGDDLADIDDEDGTWAYGEMWGGSFPLAPTITLGVNAHVDTYYQHAYVNTWIDLNADGDWDDPDEHILVDYDVVSLPAGVLELPMPGWVTEPVYTFARFRISSEPGLSYTGYAPDGEVEDVPVEIVKLELVSDPNGPYFGDEGTAITLDGSGSQPALPDVPIERYEWDVDVDGINDLSGERVNHTWPDDGDFVVRLTVTDQRGAGDADEANVSIRNLPPVVAPEPDATVTTGEPFTLMLASFIDPGILDTHTATIDWGDATPMVPGDVEETGGAGTVSGSHVYADPGDYEVEVTVTDDDGGVGHTTLVIVAEPRGVVEVGIFPETVGQIVLEVPGVGQQLINVVGPAEVHVQFEGAQEGIAWDDDGDGLDEVATELVSMNLRGTSALGPVSVGLRADRASTGQITEQVNDHPGTLEVDPFNPAGATNVPAESFFDVWPEIRLGSQVFHTAAPLPIETLISHKPPQEGERYVNPYLEPVELIDPTTGLGTGIFVVREVHQPAPTTEHDVFPHTRALVGLQLPTGELFNVRMSGPSTVDVYFEGPQEGDAVDDDLNGRDEVATQMKTLELVGTHPALGEVYLRLSADELTLGQIEENVNVADGRLDLPPFGPDGSTAESFFDVYFEVEVPSQGLLLHNQSPARMSSTITHKPPGPGDEYVKPEGPVELYDQNGQPTGIILTGARHVPNPTGVVEVDRFDYSIGQLELVTPLGVETIAVSGPATAHVYFEGPVQGVAYDDDGDGRDDVQTEMVALQLSGVSPTLGPVQVRLNPGFASLGEIEERSNAMANVLDLPPFAVAGTADSFFDLFFEIEVGGQSFYTAEPKRMSSVIHHKPPGPGDVYENVEQIPLLDANGQPVPGYYLGATRHAPRPAVEIDQFDFTVGDLELSGPFGVEMVS